MRYPASENLEIIRLVERSSRPAKWTLDKLGINRRTFYRQYDRYLHYGEHGLIARIYDSLSYPQSNFYSQASTIYTQN